MNAFEFGAPPHGGVAFGFDRWCSFISVAPKPSATLSLSLKINTGRDVMVDAPLQFPKNN